MTQATREEIARSNNKCHLCGKTFVKKTNLKHHLMLHRGEKPWKCSLCEWRFVQKCNLKKHMRKYILSFFFKNFLFIQIYLKKEIIFDKNN